MFEKIMNKINQSNLSISFVSGERCRTAYYDELTKIYLKLARDLAGFTIINSDQNNKMNYFINKKYNQFEFYQRVFFFLLKDGAVLIEKKYMTIIGDYSIENGEVYIGNKLWAKEDVIYLRFSDFTTSKINAEVLKGIDKIIANSSETANVKFLMKLKTMLDPKDLNKLKTDALSAREAGFMVYDQKVEDVKQISNGSTFDSDTLKILRGIVYEAFGLNEEIITNTQNEQLDKNYNKYVLKPVLKVLEQELRNKFDDKLRIIPNSKLELSPEEAKIIAMMGALKVDELRNVFNLPALENDEGKKLIQNWNEKKSMGGGE